MDGDPNARENTIATSDLNSNQQHGFSVPYLHSSVFIHITNTLPNVKFIILVLNLYMSYKN